MQVAWHSVLITFYNFSCLIFDNKFHFIINIIDLELRFPQRASKCGSVKVKKVE
jgi:hypothetical protein